MENNRVMETDVVVVGYGAAGAATAITACDNGARVIILEKLPAGGGSAVMSGGIIFTPTGPEAVKHVDALMGGKTPRDIIDVFVEGCLKNKEWLEDLGGKTQTFAPLEILPTTRMSACWPNYPGVEHTESRWVAGEIGKEGRVAAPLWKLLVDNVERRGIEVMTSTPAKELITNEKGEVIGVVAEREGRVISIKAKRAVVLTCGGFEYNDAMKDAYLPLTPIYPIGTPGNTGDGLIMAQKVGAALWHMNQFYGWPVFKAPEYASAFSVRFYGSNVIYINRSGRRFTSETGWEGHEASRMFMIFMPDDPNYPQLPVYAVFDDVTRRKGPLCGLLPGANVTYKWSLDNSKEISRGWIKQGRTIGELAGKISVDGAALTNTITRYNEDCQAGRDTQFGRPLETLEPLEAAPYYAIEMWPGMGTTCGGPRRDKKARVLDNEGKPIPRLYVAGGLGTIWGFLTLSGGGLTDCFVFGRIAGQNAAGEEPWS